MRKLAVIVAILISLVAFSPAESIAKPAYCYDALVKCVAQCGDVYGGGTLLYYTCAAGCNIGYLACGS